MATAQEAVRRLTIQTSAPGADQAASSLRGVDKALQGITVASASTEKATLSLDQKFASIERKYVAQVRAQQDYEKIQRQVNAAVAQNPALQERANVVLARAAERLNATGVANDNVTKSTGLARHELINLSRQAQDVAVSLASGQSPFTVLAQQGSQIADVFVSSQSGVKGFAMQAREFLASVITPGRAVVLGFTAVGAAAYGFYRLLRTEEPTVEKNLEEHARLVGIIKSAYGDATDAAGKFYSQSREQTVLQSIANIDRLKNNLRDLVTEMTKASTTPTDIGFPEMGIGPDPSAVVAQDRFRGFTAAIAQLQASIRSGAPDFEAFNRRISEIGTSEPALREAALRLIDLSKGATDVAQKVAVAEAQLRLLQGTATEADRALLNLANVINKVDVSKLREQNEIALKSLTAFSPAAKAEIAYLETRLRLQDQVNRKQLTAAEQEEQAIAARTIALRQSAISLSEINRERELGARQTVTQAQLEIDLIGRTISEQTRLRADLQARQQLEQEAARNRTVFDEAEFARLQKINAELGRKAEARARADVADQIRFERGTAFLSPQDVQIAQQLRSIYGTDIPAALASAEAAGMRFNMQMRELISLGYDINRGLFVEFGQNIRNGMSLWDSFQKAGLSALGKIADKLAEMAAQQLWSSAFGGNSSGFGSIFSSLFPGSSGSGIGTMQVGSQLFPTVGFHTGGIVGSEATFTRDVNGDVFAGAPRMHGGGIAGDEVPIIARRGEGVFTEGQMKALGGGGQPIQINYAPIIDARGADAAAVARLAGVVAEDRKNFTRNVKGVMAEQRRNNPGW